MHLAHDTVVLEIYIESVCQVNILSKNLELMNHNFLAVLDVGYFPKLYMQSTTV